MRGADVERTQRARDLRQADNEAEAWLWSDLRDRRLNGYKFLRQYPIQRYIADFACRSIRLVVELDGSQHLATTRDRRRDQALNACGWSVVRFWSNDVLSDRAAVLETLVALCDGRLVTPTIAFDLRFAPAPGWPHRR